MADKIDTLLKKMKSFDESTINDTINELAKKNEPTIVSWNTQDQIFKKGITSKGNKIKHLQKSYSKYSKGYTSRKRKLGKLQGHIDLSVYGGYLRSWNIIPEAKSFAISAKDILLKKGFNLSGHLRKIYGEDIEGLTPENMNKLTKLLQRELISSIKLELNGL